MERARKPMVRLRLSFLLFSGIILLAAASATAMWLWLPPPARAPAVFVIPAVVLASVAGGCIVVQTQRRLTSWLAMARAAADEFAAGRFEARVPVPAIKEFAPLARAINGIAEQMGEVTEGLRHRAFHDPLTGLPNRAYFMSLATRTLSEVDRTRSRLALLFIDLDRFKVLNDTLGHPAGDALLKTVATRIQAVTGSRGVCARLGGDEFTVLVWSARAERDACVMADQIIGNLSRPFPILGQQVFTSASIGIAVRDYDEQSIPELMRKADIALYSAKNRGRGRFVVFEPLMEEQAPTQLELDSDLRTAILEDQLELAYQPEIDLNTGMVVGMEALVRWNHPHRGVLSPSDFISLAQDTGQIGTLGSWVLERACKDLVEFESRESLARGLTLSVNVSATEFNEPTLASRIVQTLGQHGLVAGRLKIEITESVLMEDIDGAARTLAALGQLGVQSAIDDFGTGYSSLSYLQELPTGTLKIDQSFVHRIGTSSQSDAIVSAIIQLGRALKVRVVAEGVEDAHQAEFLRAAGCHACQGFYFSRPLSSEAFMHFLRNVKGLTAGKTRFVA